MFACILIYGTIISGAPKKATINRNNYGVVMSQNVEEIVIAVEADTTQVDKMEKSVESLESTVKSTEKTLREFAETMQRLKNSAATLPESFTKQVALMNSVKLANPADAYGKMLDVLNSVDTRLKTINSTLQVHNTHAVRITANTTAQTAALSKQTAALHEVTGAQTAVVEVTKKQEQANTSLSKSIGTMFEIHRYYVRWDWYRRNVARKGCGGYRRRRRSGGAGRRRVVGVECVHAGGEHASR